MNVRSIVKRCLMLSLTLSVSVATADPVLIDATDPQNGIFDIYSSTFDGIPPLGGDPFFGVVLPLPPGRAIELAINPSGVVANTVPGGFTVVQNGFPPGFTFPPEPGSFLDLTLSAGNTMVTLAGGTITAPNLSLVINAGQASETIVNATAAGILFNPIPVTVPVDGNGIAVFEVDPPGVGVAVDFSTFADIVGPGDCTGSLCAVIPALTLDMLKIRLTVDYDTTFSSFTAAFLGQTANFSMVSATLNSVAPDIVVTDSATPSDDQVVPFGTVTEMSISDQTVTVTNGGGGNLVIGDVALADALTAPFSIPSDNCSTQTLATMVSCAITVRFAPTSSGVFSDSFDIPSNDADQTSVTVSVNGTGTVIMIPDITVADAVAPIDDLRIPFGAVSQGVMADQRVTVTNDGNAPLTLGQVAMANPLMPPFSVINDNCSTQVIVPAGTCTLDVRFEPTASGNFADSLDIPSDDPDEPSVIVDVTGNGIATPLPDITVTDSVPPIDDLSVDFGDVTELFSTDQTVTVKNDGNADLTIGQIGLINAVSAPFAVQSDACSGQVLALMASCTIVIRFTPTSVVMSTSSFDIPSDDPDEASVIVRLTGSGVISTTSDEVISNTSGADSGFFGMALQPPALMALLLLIMVNARRRRRL